MSTTEHRDPVSVVKAHLEAVRSGDLQAMAADYHAQAVLERPDASYLGQAAISGYFYTVPARLAGGNVSFDLLDESALTVRWHLSGGPGDGTAGTDTYRVEHGLIVHQTVALDATDF